MVWNAPEDLQYSEPEAAKAGRIAGESSGSPAVPLAQTRMSKLVCIGFVCPAWISAGKVQGKVQHLRRLLPGQPTPACVLVQDAGNQRLIRKAFLHRPALDHFEVGG